MKKKERNEDRNRERTKGRKMRERDMRTKREKE